MLNSFSSPVSVAVFGASGGIGQAFVSVLSNDEGVCRIDAFSRHALRVQGKVSSYEVDITDERS